MSGHPAQKEIIGIVGGMGPFAHLDFERKLLDSARELVGATHDQDYPEWLLSSVPSTPDRTLAYIGDGDDPAPFLERSLLRLQGAADFAVITCNTAHLFLDKLDAKITIPIVSMIETTVRSIAAKDSGVRVGILATTGTLQSRLYHEALRDHGLEPFSPLDLEGGESKQLKLIMEPIYGLYENGKHRGGGIKSAKITDDQTRKMELVSAELVEAFQVEALIAGCTEIPLALRGSEVCGVRLTDPAKVLADAAIRRAYGL